MDNSENTKPNNLFNDSTIISANEINKFVYCPYQWYYERAYGKKHIRMLYNQRNERLGLPDSLQSNFVKGQAFHNKYSGVSYGKYALAAFIIIAVIGVVLLCLISPGG